MPAPLTSAPIELRKSARSTICGSLAAFSITVRPLAKTAASIIFIVAPTDTTSIYIDAPTSLSAFAHTIPSIVSTLAPSISKPLICWSIGLTPKSQPPGIATSAFLNLPSITPIR